MSSSRAFRVLVHHCPMSEALVCMCCRENTERGKFHQHITNFLGANSECSVSQRYSYPFQADQAYSSSSGCIGRKQQNCEFAIYVVVFVGKSENHVIVCCLLLMCHAATKFFAQIGDDCQCLV